MTDSRLPALIYSIMLILGLLQWARVYPQLPARMAAHFAADGTPNGFQSKLAFFILMFVIFGPSAFVAFVTPRILAGKPPERLNLPNKSYWLAPDHREETFRFCRAQMGWFGCAILFCCSTALHSPSMPTFPHAGASIRTPCSTSWRLRRLLPCLVHRIRAPLPQNPRAFARSSTTVTLCFTFL
jgi:hypothetical protein